jgi:hypothetical protein
VFERNYKTEVFLEGLFIVFQVSFLPKVAFANAICACAKNEGKSYEKHFSEPGTPEKY